MRHQSNLLRIVVHNLFQALNALRNSSSVGLVEAELVIPFVGTLAHEAVSPGLGDFHTVSLLTEDMECSNLSDIWKVHISIGMDQPSTLRLEKYDTASIT